MFLRLFWDVVSKIVKNRKWKKSIEVCFFLVLATLFDHISFNLSLCSNNIALNTPFICPFMFLRLFWMLYKKS